MTRVNKPAARAPQSPQVAISDAEAVVMEVLWAHGASTAEFVCRTLAERQPWREATVKTLLSRLLAKGAVSATADGRRYIYTPLMQRDDWVQAASQSMLDRLFGGRIAPLVAHFSRQRKLAPRDVEELRRLLKDLEP